MSEVYGMGQLCVMQLAARNAHWHAQACLEHSAGMCALQAADLACSGGAFANTLLQRQSASVSSLHGHSQGGTPRMASTSQLGTPTASLDKLQREDMLMHELDQVMRPLT